MIKTIIQYIIKYFQSLFIAVDQLANAILLGDPDETISSRVGRVAPDSLIAKIIDNIFFYQRKHCYNSIEKNEGARDLIFPRLAKK
jgi:hypothetical protein